MSATSVGGLSIVTTIATELKNIKETDVDPSMFVIPAGYTKVDK